jgi:hypothetical protein
MFRRNKRRSVFVCLGLKDGKLLSEEISEFSKLVASAQFFQHHGIRAEIIYGPFRQRRTKRVPDNNRTIRFTDQVKKAEYQGWLVNASILSEPEGHAFLLFLSRLDGKKQLVPKGSVIVPIEDLKVESVQ